MDNYIDLKPFKFWCQKVLPLVYDDSLSYYELLCKVVDYLNKTMENVEILHSDVTNLHTAYEKLKSYVNNYFSSLDVQEEINNKLDDMASSGELGNIIYQAIGYEAVPQFVDSVSKMTNKRSIYVLTTNAHIYQYSNGTWNDTGVTYSDSIIHITPSNTDIKSSGISNANDLPINMIYGITSNTTNTDVINLPLYGKSAIIYSISPYTVNNSIQYQYYINNENTIFTRYKTSTWSKWISINGRMNTDLKSANITNVNDLDYNTIYGVSNTYANSGELLNLPSNIGGIIYTISGYNNIGSKVQLYFDNNGNSYNRILSTKWSEWTNIGNFTSTSISINKETNIDNIKTNGIYAISTVNINAGINAPNLAREGGTLLDFSFDKTGMLARTQLYSEYNNSLHTRTHNGVSGWNEWLKFPTDEFYNSEYFIKTCVNHKNKITNNSVIAVFGDSITTNTHGGVTWLYYVCKDINCNGNSYGVGGASFTGENNILSQINRSDINWNSITNVIVAGGVNDALNNFNIETFKESVQNVITVLKNKTNASITFITPLKNGVSNQSTLSKISGIISNVALLNNCSVLNGYDIPIPWYTNDIITEFVDGDKLHPNLIGKQVYANYVEMMLC